MEEKKMTFKSNFKAIGMTIFVFLLPFCLFFSLLLTNYYKVGMPNWSESVQGSLVFFGIISLLTIPGFLLHFRYYFKDKGKSLVFQKMYFDFIVKGESTKIDYSDLIKVEKHKMYWSNRNPWKGYGYIKLFLKSGQTFSYSCLTHDHISSAILFKMENVLVEDYEEIYPW
jgi:hypothetical protein